jgi:hypothetical protein
MTNEADPSRVSPEQMEFPIKLEGIFMPQARKRRDAFYGRQASGTVTVPARFVHYTSAEAALHIINSKRVWMRNATCMSDYREVQHGFSILKRFFADESNTAAFTAALDTCVPGAARDAIALFDRWWNDIQFHTYIASISEHDPKEDVHGRLSMWRAFGSNATRVAIVFNLPWDSGGAAALNVLFSPVAYLTESEAHAMIYEVVANIKAHSEFLRSIEPQTVTNFVFNMLVIGVTCLKHEGFREEREWRAIYSPHRLPSTLMEAGTEVIAGVPQLLYKAPLDATVSSALAGLEFSRIFDRLIIGPSQHPWPMVEAFTEALQKAGVPQDPAKQRLFISGIPIRT